MDAIRKEINTRGGDPNFDGDLPPELRRIVRTSTGVTPPLPGPSPTSPDNQDIGQAGADNIQQGPANQDLPASPGLPVSPPDPPVPPAPGPGQDGEQVGADITSPEPAAEGPATNMPVNNVPAANVPTAGMPPALPGQIQSPDAEHQVQSTSAAREEIGTFGYSVNYRKRTCSDGVSRQN